jgi:GNAT superfamily N-acetyltransferase
VGQPGQEPPPAATRCLLAQLLDLRVDGLKLILGRPGVALALQETDPVVDPPAALDDPRHAPDGTARDGDRFGGVPVRTATRADLPTVHVLIRALADYEHLADEVALDEAELGQWLFGDEPAAHVLFATEDDGTIAGMALWYVTFSTFLGKPGIWLEDLFVLPDHRGRGHGLALLGALRARTAGRVEWAVLDWNQPAIDFYERLGARPVPGWTRYRWVTTAHSGSVDP